MSFFHKDEDKNKENAERAKKTAEKKRDKAKKELRMDLREKGIAAYGGGTIIAIVILSITTLAFGTAAALLYMSNADNIATVSSSYSKAYYQLVMDANELETSLSKALAASGNYKGQLLYEASSTAQSLQNNLAVIPSEKEVETLSAFKFCNQTMDYTKYLAKKTYNGEEITLDEERNLESILETASKLKESLNMSYEYYGNNKDLFSMGILSGAFLSPVDISYDDLNESSIEYPTLIYDGPFSDIKELSEEELKEKNKVSREEAANKARELFGEDVSPMYEDENSDLAYTFSVGNGDTVVQISKQNGELLLLSKYREVGTQTISSDDGMEKAKKYLESVGFSDLEPVWKSETYGMLTINFAQSIDGTVCYSRLIKVVVALDNGEILGLEGTTYVARHEKQVDTMANISIAKAKDALSDKLEVISSRPAVIPKNENEIMTFEFFAEMNGNSFYIYVDAKTGEEIEVLKVVENESQGQNVI